MPTLLGCANQYTVELHAMRRVDNNGNPLPRAEMYFMGSFDGVLRVDWERILRDTSTCTIDIDMIEASPDCCRLFEKVEARVSQIRLWRDNKQVWEGEVVQRIETFGVPTKRIVAHDIMIRLDEVANTQYLWTEEKQPITITAYNMIRDNLLDEAFDDPVDSSLILDGIIVEDTDEVIHYRRGAVVDSVGNILRQMAQSYALDFTVINRSLRLVRRVTSQDQTIARLTTEHVDGQADVVVNGLEAGTRGWATTQREGDSQGDPGWPGITETFGITGSRYGRIDVIRHLEDANSDRDDVARAARNAIWNRNPPPTEVRMPSESTLTPSAPLGMDDLIPGFRIDMFVIEGLCVPIRQGMRLATLNVIWTADRTETVSIGMSTLSDVTGALHARTVTVMDSQIISVMPPAMAARQLGRVIARASTAGGRVTGSIGYTDRDGNRIIRTWDDKGRMIETKARKLDI